MVRGGYQYETSPRKLEPEYRPQRKKQQRPTKPKSNTKVAKKEKRKKVRQTLTVFALFVVLVAISYRNSEINESFTKVQSLKTELSAIEKENEQLEVSIENSLNLNNIEQIAKEKLGMRKLTNRQTVYVELPKKDYVKPATENIVIRDEENWFNKLLNKIFNR